MSEFVKIAVDAMGGDNSPKKIIDGIIENHNNDKNNFYKIFGDKNEIEKLIDKKINKNNFEITHTQNKVTSEDSPLEAAKRGKDTSMWLAVESVKKKKRQILLFQRETQGLY